MYTIKGCNHITTIHALNINGASTVKPSKNNIKTTYKKYHVCILSLVNQEDSNTYLSPSNHYVRNHNLNRGIENILNNICSIIVLKTEEYKKISYSMGCK